MGKPGLALGVAAALAAACGSDGGETSPYGEIEVAREIDAPGLSHPVDIVRDHNGTPHIWAQTIEDAAFAHGYVMAADRLPVLDLVRHAALGTSAEIAGGLDRSVIEVDILARAHGFAQRADAAIAELEASTDPLDQEMLTYLQRYCDGINLFGEQLQRGELNLDGAIRIFYNEELFTEFSPSDLIAIVYLAGLQGSYLFSEKELDRTRAAEAARALFDEADPGTDPALAARAGAIHDLWSLRAVDPTPTIDGFQRAAAPGSSASDRRRPRVPVDLLRRLTRRPRGPIAEQLLPRSEHSNNWAISGSLTGGAAIFANDPHGNLANPNRFTVSHVTVPGELDTWGAAYFGHPGYIIGFTRDLAWGVTTSNYDATDFYLEQIVPCTGGGGDCVMFEGAEVPLETRQETIRVGTLGAISETITVDIEFVPHHGPILIEHDDAGDPIPRSGSTAISVRFAGDVVSHEMRFAYRLGRTTEVAGAMALMDHIQQLGMNMVFADSAGDIAWSTQQDMPWHDAGCFSYDPVSNPYGVAPWFVLPGDGSCEWDGLMDRDLIPHAVAPAKGWLATANADPVGATANGNPLDDGQADGRPIYVGWSYEPGYRISRISRRIEELIADGDLSVDAMAELQTDDYSNFGSRMLPHLQAALAALAEERATPGTHADLETWAAGLDPAAAARLADAADRLSVWSLHTPSGVGAADGSDEAADSIATAMFSAWTVHFVDLAFGDELALLDEGLDKGGSRSRDISRAAYAVFERPNELYSGLSSVTGEPVLCDDLTTDATEESCTLIAVMAMDAALEFLAGPDAMDTDDVDAWRWGAIHRITLDPLIPSRDLEVPPPDEADGLPQGGDQFAVDNADFGYEDLDFAQNHGPDFRLLVELTADGPKAKMALAGGSVFDTFSPHYRDQLPVWLDDTYVDIPFSVEEILAAAEERWRLY